jgi:hypothetical protein
MELLAVQRLAIELSYGVFLQILAIGLLWTLLMLVLTKKKLVVLRLNRFARWALLLVAVLPILNYLFLIWRYFIAIDYADPAEANVVSVAWLFQGGRTLYPALDAAERYINNYGPFLYIVQGLFLKLFQPSFWSSKLVGCLAGVASLGLLLLTLKHRLPWTIALFCGGVISLGLLSLTSASGLLASAFWVRPDSLLLFFTAIAVVAVLRGGQRTAVIVSAIALGVSLNLKVIAFLHFVPLYAILLQRFGLSWTMGAMVGAVAIAIAPFVVVPTISFSNYATWLLQVRQKGINPEQIVKNLLWIGYVALPCAIASLHLYLINPSSYFSWVRQHRLYLCLLAIGVMTTAIVGALRGALENNLLPFVPLFAGSLNQLLQRITRMPLWGNRKQFAAVLLSMNVTLAFVVSVTMLVYSTEAGFLARLGNAPGAAAVQDLHRILQAYPNRSIGMGYGGTTSELPNYRPVLVFAGQPYLLDSASLMEMQAAGLKNTPDATVDAIAACKTQIWLIPKNNKPFDLHNFYPPLQKLFNDQFRQVFRKRHRRIQQTQFYDVWACKR